jgi:hypothetical protein
VQKWRDDNQHLFSSVEASMLPRRALTYEDMAQEFGELQKPIKEEREQQSVDFLAHVARPLHREQHGPLIDFAATLPRAPFSSRADLAQAWLCSLPQAVEGVRTLPTEAVDSGIPPFVTLFRDLSPDAVSSALQSTCSRANIETARRIIASPLFDKISLLQLRQAAKAAAEEEISCLSALFQSRRGREISSSQLGSFLVHADNGRRCFQAIGAVGRLGEIDSPALNKAFLQAVNDEDYLSAFLDSEVFDRIETATLIRGFLQAAEKAKANCLAFLLRSRRAAEISHTDLGIALIACASASIPGRQPFAQFLQELIALKLFERIPRSDVGQALQRAVQFDSPQLNAHIRSGLFNQIDPSHLGVALSRASSAHFLSLLSLPQIGRVTPEDIRRALLHIVQIGDFACVERLSESGLFSKIPAAIFSNSLSLINPSLALPYIDLLIRSHLLPQLSAQARGRILVFAALGNRLDLVDTMRNAHCFRDIRPKEIGEALMAAVISDSFDFAGKLAAVSREQNIPFDKMPLRTHLTLLTAMPHLADQRRINAIAEILRDGRKHPAPASPEERPSKASKRGGKR